LKSKASNTVGRPAKPVDESTYAGRFAARLRKLRETAGLTGEEMADAITKAGYECPKNTYYNWESGSRDVALNAVPAIATALETKIRTIFPNE
jgi:transcriptional regulator with XRE-family HTH domain